MDAFLILTSAGSEFARFASAYDITALPFPNPESSTFHYLSLPLFVLAPWSLYPSLPGGSCGGDPSAHPASVAIYSNPALWSVQRVLRRNMPPPPARVFGADTSTKMAVG